MNLIGWGEHYRTATLQEVFSSISYRIWKACYAMLRKKHRRRNASWIFNKYFTKKDGNKWILCSKHRKTGDTEITLFQIAYVEIKRHSLCRHLNPYDPENYAYFKKRRASGSRQSLLLGKVRTSLLRKQRKNCPVCKIALFNEEDLKVRHVKPRKLGGTDKPSNLRLFHKECHKQVTTSKDENLLAI